MSGDTRIFEAMQTGQPQAAEELLPLVYEELQRVAAAKMPQERPGQTLQATAPVHEDWFRLSGQHDARWQHREQFFAIATTT
jgi:hypothetical protein